MHLRVRLARLRLKSDLINWIGWQQQYASYLEIATPTTGHQFKRIARDVFRDVRRVVYRAGAADDDGLGDTMRTPLDDSGSCLDPLIAAGARFDLVFADPYHTLEHSARDLARGLALLAPGGTLVVHDCHPTRESLAAPEQRDGEWMGHTYQAFLDVVARNPELDYCVVDMDYGCGVIRRRADWPQGTRLGTNRGRARLDAIPYGVWSAYRAHAADLLQLVSPEEFVRRVRVRPPSIVARANPLRLRSPRAGMVPDA